jgi:ubiquinone/menaquinone biosynthesis C-methylase UbiE
MYHAKKLPFQSDYFDMIYMDDIIDHLVDPDYAINEVARVMKTNGFQVLSTPNLASWLNRLLLLLGIPGRFGRSDSFPVGHLRLFTYEALKKF